MPRLRQPVGLTIALHPTRRTEPKTISPTRILKHESPSGEAAHTWTEWANYVRVCAFFVVTVLNVLNVLTSICGTSTLLFPPHAPPLAIQAVETHARADTRDATSWLMQVGAWSGGEADGVESDRGTTDQVFGTASS